MLDTLKYAVTFPTGRSFNRELNFSEGMTAIIGPNEQGKSLTLELIRFCLFGTGALRGDADDYKQLQAELAFRVRGVKLSVVRSTKNAVLSEGGEVTVRGIKPVNLRIVEILGFDLTVFDVACAAGQGDVERLAEMKPTARREMVDRLIGADRIEDVSSWAAEQALLLKREIDVLERGLVEPVAPEKPEGWQDAQVLAKAIVEKQAKRDEVVQLRAWLSTRPAAVEVPEAPPHAFDRKVLDQAEEVLQRPVYDFDIAEAKHAISAWDEWQGRLNFEAQVPRPVLGVTVQIAKAEIELQRLNRELEALLKSPKLCCPECGHTFTLEDEAVLDIRNKIVDQKSLRGMVLILNVSDWHQQLRLAQRWEDPKVLANWDLWKDVQEAAKPAVTATQIYEAEQGGIKRATLDAMLTAAGLEGATLQTVRVLRRQLDQFEATIEAAGPAKRALAAWEAEEPAKRKALAKAESLSEGLEQDRALLATVVAYDSAMERYAGYRENYLLRVDEVDDKREERQSWLIGKDQLNVLRTKLKGYLAPSLSTAASALLSQMTRGARRAIWVDENFEITVDGQKLQTLSGSGKVCANLALRIGLAQVLTNNVFSVFIGDEMDAFMDAERVAALNESLERLTTRVKQIIIITHKPPVCKQVIDLGVLQQ